MELCSRGCDSPLVPRAVRLLLRGGLCLFCFQTKTGRNMRHPGMSLPTRRGGGARVESLGESEKVGE